MEKRNEPQNENELKHLKRIIHNTLSRLFYDFGFSPVETVYIKQRMLEAFEKAYLDMHGPGRIEIVGELLNQNLGGID